MYVTYATNKTILYLQNNTYLQCEILTLRTILYSTYDTKLAILTYNEILTLLTVLYSTLYIYMGGVRWHAPPERPFLVFLGWVAGAWKSWAQQTAGVSACLPLVRPFLCPLLPSACYAGYVF